MTQPQSFRCPACGGDAVTPPMELRASNYSFRAIMPPVSSGFFAQGTSLPIAGRVCGNCGHTSLWASPKGLEYLRQSWNAIKWDQADV